MGSSGSGGIEVDVPHGEPEANEKDVVYFDLIPPHPRGNTSHLLQLL